MIESILTAWHASWPSEPELTATQILKRTSGNAVTDPTIKALRSALESACPAINTRKLGKYLAKHDGAEHGQLRLARRYDAHKKITKYTVWRAPTDAELEAEHAALMAAAEQREAEFEREFALASPAKQLRMLERKDNERRKREAEPETKPDLRRRENKPAPVQLPEPEPAPEPLSVHVRPGGSRCWSEKLADEHVRKLRGYGLDATAIYDRTGGMIIRVRGVSVYEVRRACKSFRRLEFCDVSEAPKVEPARRQLCDGERRALARAAGFSDHPMSRHGMPAYTYPKTWTVFDFDRPRPNAQARWDAIESMRKHDVVDDWRDTQPNVSRKPKPEDEF